MKVIILSMTVGQGHNLAANALKQYLESKDNEVIVLDTYKFLNVLIGEGFDKGYSFMGRYWTSLSDKIYDKAQQVNDQGGNALKTYFPYVFSDIFKSKLKKYIEMEKPDAIVCTHVLCTLVVTQLKDKNMMPEIPVYSILTDYALHPLNNHVKFDYLIVANEVVAESVACRGIPREKILPFGIPVKAGFAKTNDKDEIRKKLGLPLDKQIILCSGGGRGFGALDQLVEQADQIDNVCILAMTGTNFLLKKKLENMEFKNEIHVYEFVNNMDEFLDAADFIVCKPGGLSTQEALAKERVMILMPPLPGIEDSNLAFLINNSLAVHTNKHMPLFDVIRMLMSDQDRLDHIKRQLHKFAKPESSKMLGDFIMSQYEHKKS